MEKTPHDTRNVGYRINESVYRTIDESIAQRRHELTVETRRAFSPFSRQVFSDGALPTKVRQLIAVAVVHVTQCPFCIDAHTQLAINQGVRDEAIMEAMCAAAEMRAGGAYSSFGPGSFEPGLMSIVESENRSLVLLQWAWNYFTWNRAARLITDENPLPLR